MTYESRCCCCCVRLQHNVNKNLIQLRNVMYTYSLHCRPVIVINSDRRFAGTRRLLLLLGRVALVAQRPTVVKLSRGRSVGLSVRTCVARSVSLSSALWKNGGSDPDGVWCRRSDGSMDEAGIVKFGDRSTGRGTFGGEFGVRHCNQRGLYGVRVQQRRDAALFPNYFGQTLSF